MRRGAMARVGLASVAALVVLLAGEWRGGVCVCVGPARVSLGGEPFAKVALGGEGCRTTAAGVVGLGMLRGDRQ